MTTCLICKKVFSSTFNMNRHMKNAHYLNGGNGDEDESVLDEEVDDSVLDYDDDE